MRRLDYNSIDWNKHFFLDEKSPSFLSWKRKAMAGTGRVMFNPGDHCLTKDSWDYYQVNLGSTSYKIHIIVYVMWYGDYDNTLEIDHIDGNRSNNNPYNLRQVSKAVNNRNVSFKSHNTSGVTGVTYWRGYWRAKISFDHEHYQKLFSIKKLGSNSAFALACQWRTTKMQELKNNGAQFTDRHGELTE